MATFGATLPRDMIPLAGQRSIEALTTWELAVTANSCEGWLAGLPSLWHLSSLGDKAHRVQRSLDTPPRNALSETTREIRDTEGGRHTSPATVIAHRPSLGRLEPCARCRSLGIAGLGAGGGGIVDVLRGVVFFGLHGGHGTAIDMRERAGRIMRD